MAEPWLRPLGDTGLLVSALGLGTVKLGRDEGVKYPAAYTLPDPASARELLALAQDLGVNFLDTAPAYGSSEERLGELLRGQRQRWVIASKVGEIFDGGVSQFDFSPVAVRASVHRSLRRLQTDWLDLVLIHSNGRDADILTHSGALEALRDLQLEGLVHSVGISTKTVEGGMQAARCVDVVMATLNPSHLQEWPVFEACARSGCAVLVKKALASGHGAVGAGAVSAALSLALSAPAVASVVVGTIQPVHLRANVAAAHAALL